MSCQIKKPAYKTLYMILYGVKIKQSNNYDLQ